VGDVAAVAEFVAGAVVSLLASWLLVLRLERIGERLGLSEALLGMVAALAADAPEVTAAVSALASHQQRIGAGVVLGSNVFNLAALLGLGAVVAGRISLHRKVVVLSGTVAVWVALVSVVVVSGVVPPMAGLVLAAGGVGLYLFVLARGGRGLRLPDRWQAWLRSAVSEDELELTDAIRPSRGRWPDAILAALALAAVVVASVTMERAAASLGQRAGVAEIITGGLVLAAVTSLPNAVAAVYLASRGRGAATLSTALNSNTLNVVAGLLLPGVLLGLGRPTGQTLLVTCWYAGLTLAVLAIAWRHRGLTRPAGAAVIAAYAAFTISVVISGSQNSGGAAVSAGLAALSFLILLAALSWISWPAPVPGQPSLLPGWSVRRLWAVSMTVTAAVAAIDAATGHHLILIGLLIAGPCIALLTGKPIPTALAGAWACGLAVLLGLPDGIWATTTHLAFIAAVATVAAAAIAGSAVISRAKT
jgi:cation:H+ antiporter